MKATARRGAILLVLVGATAVGCVRSSIIGLHDPMGTETLGTLQNIIPAVTAQGYRFETVSALVNRRRQSR